MQSTSHVTKVQPLTTQNVALGEADVVAVGGGLPGYALPKASFGYKPKVAVTRLPMFDGCEE